MKVDMPYVSHNLVFHDCTKSQSECYFHLAEPGISPNQRMTFWSHFCTVMSGRQLWPNVVVRDWCTVLSTLTFLDVRDDARGITWCSQQWSINHETWSKFGLFMVDADLRVEWECDVFAEGDIPSTKVCSTSWALDDAYLHLQFFWNLDTVF